MSTDQSNGTRDRPTLPFGSPIHRDHHGSNERAQNRRPKIVFFIHFDGAGELGFQTIGQQQRQYVGSQLDGGRRDYDGRREQREHERLFLFGRHRRAEQYGEEVRRAHRQYGGDDELEQPNDRVRFRLDLVRYPADQIRMTGELDELDGVTRADHDQRVAVQQQIVILVQQQPHEQSQIAERAETVRNQFGVPAGFGLNEIRSGRCLIFGRRGGRVDQDGGRIGFFQNVPDVLLGHFLLIFFL